MRLIFVQFNKRDGGEVFGCLVNESGEKLTKVGWWRTDNIGEAVRLALWSVKLPIDTEVDLF